jgi:tetratricopeptide (TPR) repeat protein
MIENQIGAEIEAVLNYRESLAHTPAAADSARAYLTDTRSVSAALGNRLRAGERGAVIRIYTIAGGDLEMRAAALENEFREGNTLITGVPREVVEIGVYTARYPAEGAAILIRMSQGLTAGIADTRALLARYSAEPETVLGDNEVNPLYLSAQNLLNRLLALERQSAGIIAGARVQIDQANALKVEGDRLFQEAQTALARNNFDLARESLERVTNRYNASLAIQESESLRNTWRNRVIPLGDDVTRIENEVVVRDVRTLLKTAETRYFEGNMELAEDALVRAQNRWRVTNVTEHPEVEPWLRLVRSAMSLQSGRTIAATAPLYAEMSLLLSDARRNYDEGVRLLGSRRDEGLAWFAAALGKIREVQLIFPMNHDARMLELRIEQLTDPAAFNANFRQRLDAAQAGTKTKNTQSFAELQDLAEINPGFPGIRAILSQAEMDMDLRPPPPNERDLARSAELGRNAQTVVAARDDFRYEIANAWLEEAIRLNPNNAQAQTLLDQLQILMTGTGRFILDSYTQDRYNLAQREFLRGNYLSANAIVLQLLQNSENRKSTLLQDLKRRIESVL